MLKKKWLPINGVYGIRYEADGREEKKKKALSYDLQKLKSASKKYDGGLYYHFVNRLANRYRSSDKQIDNENGDRFINGVGVHEFGKYAPALESATGNKYTVKQTWDKKGIADHIRGKDLPVIKFVNNGGGHTVTVYGVRSKYHNWDK